MAISITVFFYERGQRFNVTMNSVQDNVLALKVAIRNYNNLALEHIQLLFGSSADLEDWRTLAHYKIDDGCTVSLTTRNTNLVSIESGVEKISAKAVDSSSRLVKYRGLRNQQGRTDALNSVLQTFFMTPQFRQMIVSEASKASPHYKTDQHARLFVELGKLFERLQNDKLPFACLTIGITKALGWTRRETGQQNDAHVVFRDILRALQGSASFHTKMINDIFYTELEDWTQCMECGDVMKQIQSVSSLAVPIQGHNSVEGCLRSFFNVVDEIPGFACQKCDKLVTVTKKWQYTKVAPILAVNLMRFQQNGNRVVKLNDRLSFNTILYFDYQTIYALYAVINHTGTVDSGHYFAYIRDPPQDQWFRFDDSVVSPITHQIDHGIQSIAGHSNYELASSSAYILFYKKIGPIMASATAEGTPV